MNAAQAVPMTQGESQGALAWRVPRNPSPSRGLTRCALWRAATASATAASTPGWSARSEATADGARSATKKPSRRTFASSSCPTFAPSWTPRSSTRPGRRSPRNARATSRPRAGRLRISQRLKKAEERLKECERERDEAIERAKSGVGAGATQNGTQGGGGRDGDAAAWNFLRPSAAQLAATENVKKRPTKPLERGEGTILRAFDPNREETLERERVEAEDGAAEARGGGRAAAQGVDAWSIHGPDYRSRSRRESLRRERVRSSRSPSRCRVE